MNDLGPEIGAIKREPLFDVIKALMMVWVIWGHLGLYGIVPPYSSSVPYMVNAKIGVNMPIFFVISGYLAAFTFAKAPFEKCLARSITIIWPQVFYAFCAAVLVLVLTGVGFAGTLGQVMTFWFLRCIALIYLSSAAVFYVFKTEKLRWLVFSFLYLALLFWPRRYNIWWTGQLIHMFPYFVFGLMVLSRYKLFKKNSVGVICGFIFASAVLLQGNSDVNGMNFWRVDAHWRAVLFHIRDFVTFFARTAVGLTGSMFVLWLVDKGLKLFSQLSFLAKFGTTSLGVYVIHEWVLLKLGHRFPIFPLPEWTRWFVALFYFIVCHYIVIAIKSFRWTDCLFFGNEASLTKVLLRLGNWRREK